MKNFSTLSVVWAASGMGGAHSRSWCGASRGHVDAYHAAAVFRRAQHALELVFISVASDLGLLVVLIRRAAMARALSKASGPVMFMLHDSSV